MKSSEIEEPKGPKDPDWYTRELRYWQGAYDRLKRESLAIQNAQDRWKEGHEQLFRQLEQFKQWYADLLKDRDRFKEWDEAKRLELERCNTSLKATMSALDKSYAEVEIWKREHKKTVDLIAQWELWYNSLSDDRDRYKQWDEEKRQELERKNLELDNQGKEIHALRERISVLLWHPLEYLKQMIAERRKKNKYS